MKTSKLLGRFLKMSGYYADCAAYLAEHGYTDEYMAQLLKKRELARGGRRVAEGTALIAQARLFRGELSQAVSEFERTDIKKLPEHIDSVFLNNYILCLFLKKDKAGVRRLYEEHNRILLADNTLVMRRTIGIKEYIDRRYENAVTVFVKLISEPDPRNTLMADICLVKAMLALDMNDRAAQIADAAFYRYEKMGDITAEVNSLRLKIKGKRRTGGKKEKKAR